MRFLAALPDPPATPAALTVEHMDLFRAHRSATIGDVAWMEFREICLLAKRPDPRLLMLTCATTCPGALTGHRSKPGYSDSELNG